MITTYQPLINGNACSGFAQTIDVLNPANESVFAQCEQISAKQLDDVVSVAKAAQPAWANQGEDERAILLHLAINEIEARAEEIAAIIVSEQGKPFALAMGEVHGGVAWARYAADQTLPINVLEDSDSKRIVGVRKPLGVVASITPWNWPFMIAIWHLFPALITGNTVICKPSGVTPINTLLLGEILNNHLPKGVVNIVLGNAEIGEAISSHQDINKIIFTGSTKAGQSVMRNSAASLKRLTLELGGNDAGIVLPNSDIQAFAAEIFASAFLNMGQTCGALKRLYVHRSQHQELAQALVDIANSQIVGDGMAEDTTFGPVTNAQQLARVVELVDNAVQEGATIECGGQPLNMPGYFYPPTIVTHIEPTSGLVAEEQFGPALPIIVYDDIDQAIAMANECELGLSGSVWGPDVDEAANIASQLEVGTAWVNGHAQIQPNVPMGGCKMSGFGLEFGEEGLLEFTSYQVVHINK